MHIVIIDYGVGNVYSVKNALYKAGAKSVLISSDKKTILNASHIVLPGVGAISDCLKNIQNFELTDILLTASKKSVFLGICVGMQMLCTKSFEGGEIHSFDIFSGNIEHFNNLTTKHIKVPHVGWNNVNTSSHPMFKNINNDSYFYFVHSFALKESENATSYTDYEDIKFVSSIGKDNIFATQFHPEKSGDNGILMLKNFINWNGEL